MTRGAVAAVIVPKLAASRTAFGFESGGVFVKLEISVRNSMFAVSFRFVRLIVEKSKLQ